MCGIVGYIGKKSNSIELVTEGLRNLEYRGYDSAGVTYKNGENFETVKAVGQIVNLEKKLDKNIRSNLAIGHTRWATHGTPSEDNSHPHKSGKIIIVHNGIIENYQDLKQKLIKFNVKFVSDTDTEVAAAWVNYLYENKGNLLDAIVEFKKTVKGSYAIAMLCTDDLEHLYAIRKSSPLIIGVDKDGYFVSSDVPAILKNTSNYVLLEDGDFAKISVEKLEIFESDKKEKKFEIKKFEGDENSIDKNGFEHFMLKEIHDEPEIFKKLLNKYIKNLNLLPDLCKYKRITIVACGSAYHAGLLGKFAIEKNLNIPVNVEIASEFRYKKLFINSDDLVIAVSQSGETADTLSAIKISKALGARTLGIVNVKESSIAREVDDVIYTEAGSEIAVATTKAYVAQVIIFIMLSYRGLKISCPKIEKIPATVEKLIDNMKKYEEIANKLYNQKHIFFIGRLQDYALCMEASLKLKEISYIHSEAYAAGELKHGTISLIDNETFVVGIVTNEKLAEKTISNLKEVKARGAKIILIVTEKTNFISDLYDEKIVIPEISEEFTSLLAIIPMQLIAYLVAKKLGCSIDKPKNLAKSVTVE